MSKRQSPVDLHCPCGSGKAYTDCCQPLHTGKAIAATAEQLMRSRYSAFSNKLTTYLLDSWHASTRPAEISAAELDGVKWLDLSIAATEAGQPGDLRGVVEFIARCKINGRASRLHERSNFIFETGRWFYVDGRMLSD